MNGYVVFPNAEAFYIWVGSVDAALGYPCPERKTTRYTEGVVHPVDGRVLAGITDSCPEELSDGLVAHDYLWAISEGWFSDEDPGETIIGDIIE